MEPRRRLPRPARALRLARPRPVVVREGGARPRRRPRRAERGAALLGRSGRGRARRADRDVQRADGRSRSSASRRSATRPTRSRSTRRTCGRSPRPGRATCCGRRSSTAAATAPSRCASGSPRSQTLIARLDSGSWGDDIAGRAERPRPRSRRRNDADARAARDVGVHRLRRDADAPNVGLHELGAPRPTFSAPHRQPRRNTDSMAKHWQPREVNERARARARRCARSARTRRRDGVVADRRRRRAAPRSAATNRRSGKKLQIETRPWSRRRSHATERAEASAAGVGDRHGQQARPSARTASGVLPVADVTATAPSGERQRRPRSVA